jgi:hypothetical protein
MHNRHTPETHKTHEHERSQDHKDDRHFHQRVYNKLTHFEELTIMKFNELIQANQSIKDQLNKAEAEIIAKVTDLQTKIDELVNAASNADLPQEVVDSLTEVQTASQALDDIVPDEVPPIA